MTRISRLLLIVSVFAFYGFASCTPEGGDDNAFNSTVNNVNNQNNNLCTDGTYMCFNNVIQVCQNGSWLNQTVCGTGVEPPVCDYNNGSPRCANCVANGTTCGDDNNVHACDANGEIGLVAAPCDSATGETCIEANGTASCDSPCIRAASNKSYRGCDYWMVSMVNGQLDAAFDDNYGIVVDNSNDIAAHVVISGPGVNVDEDIPANTLKVFTLAYNESIKMAGTTTIGDPLQSGIYRSAEGNGANHLTSTIPITVYQFNPYDYEIAGTNSYSNDASLVMPTTVLSTNYIVMSRPTMHLSNGASDLSSPGAVAIIATEDNTTVTFDSKAYTASGAGVGALNPGGSMQYQLNQGDVLQIVSSQEATVASCPGVKSGPDANGYTYCDPGKDYDLTGSGVTTTKPVAVWGGHSCDFIPYDSWACDHLEEMMFPLETWGKHFYLGQTHQVEQGSNEANIVRILSGDNGVTVSFNPPVENPVTLNKGEYVEFMPDSNSHFEIDATGPIMVGKFTVGQNYWTDDYDAMGDPAFGLVVPVAQFRSEYTFTTPQSITVNYVNVIALIPVDSQDFIMLDGAPILGSQYEPIGTTGWGVAKMDVTSTGTNGAHKIVAPTESITFGIEVYGFANFTSYLYPGGLDLEYINPIGK
jgi:IgGFc binding protein